MFLSYRQVSIMSLITELVDRTREDLTGVYTAFQASAIHTTALMLTLYVYLQNC